MRRRLVVEGTGKDMKITEVIVNDCIPCNVKTLRQESLVYDEDYAVSLEQTHTDDIMPANYSKAKTNMFLEQPLLGYIMSSVDGKAMPLCQQFSFVGGDSFSDYERNRVVKAKGYTGATLWDEFNKSSVARSIAYAVRDVYDGLNPLTQKDDIDIHSELTPYIGLVTFSEAMPPQYDEFGNAYFNPEGTVSVGEFLDSLLAIKTGNTSDLPARRSLDGMSDSGDFYNKGYNMCLETLSSPFYRMYTRNDMTTPITRMELAYIIVVCWSDFTDKYDTIYSGRFQVGVNLNWDSPQKYVSKFKDGRSYKIYKKCHATELGKITAVDVNFYKGEDTSMRVFRQKILNGEKAIPLPMFMSLLEIDALDIFPFFDSVALEPMKEVSRGELAYVLVKLAKLFNKPFVDPSENSY